MILKSAETGAGLYFTFMNQPTSVLQDTDYTQYYACNFTDWKDTTIELYKKFNNNLVILTVSSLQDMKNLQMVFIRQLMKVVSLSL